MVTKGIIKSIDIKGNTCVVRIPSFETAGDNEFIATATVSNTPGSYNGYKTNDVVWIAFEDDQLECPVVIGKLYLGIEAERADPRGTLNVESSKVSKSAEIPFDTKLSRDIEPGMPKTTAPFTSLNSMANTISTAEMNISQNDRDYGNRFKQVSSAIDEQGANLRSEILQTAEKISLTVSEVKEDLEGKISSTESNFSVEADKIRGEVSRIETDLNGKISNTNTSLLQTAEDIRLEATNTKNELLGSIDGLQTQITENKAAFEVNAAEIKGTVESVKKDLQGQIDTTNSALTQTADNINAEVSKKLSNVSGINQSNLGWKLTEDNWIINAHDTVTYADKDTLELENEQSIEVANKTELGTKISTFGTVIEIAEDKKSFWLSDNINNKILVHSDTNAVQLYDNIAVTGIISNDSEESIYLYAESIIIMSTIKELEIFRIERDKIVVSTDLIVQGYTLETIIRYAQSETNIGDGPTLYEDYEQDHLDPNNIKKDWTTTVPEWQDGKYIWQWTQTVKWEYQENKWVHVATDKVVCLAGSSSASFWLNCSALAHAGNQQTSDITITAKMKIGTMPEEDDTSATFTYKWGYDGEEKVINTYTYTWKASELDNKNLIITAYRNHQVYQSTTVMYSPQNTPILVVDCDNPALNYDSYGENKIDDNDSIKITASALLNNEELDAEYSWILKDCSSSKEKPTEWREERIDNKELIIYHIAETVDLATAMCIVNYTDSKGDNQAITKTVYISKNKQGKSLYKVDIFNEYVTFNVNYNVTEISSKNLSTFETDTTHEVIAYYGDEILPIIYFTEENKPSSFDPKTFYLKIIPENVEYSTEFVENKLKNSLTTLSSVNGSIIYELYRGETRVASSKFEVMLIQKGDPNVSYTLNPSLKNIKADPDGNILEEYNNKLTFTIIKKNGLETPQTINVEEEKENDIEVLKLTAYVDGINCGVLTPDENNIYTIDIANIKNKVIIELADNNSHICIDRITIDVIKDGNPATSYWLKTSTPIHLGTNQQSNIEITPMKRRGIDSEEEDNAAYLRYKWGTNGSWNNWTNGSLSISLASTQAADLIVQATHLDPTNNITDKDIYDNETITYSPANMPILDLSEDSGEIKYDPLKNDDDNYTKINSDDQLTTTATPYLGGTPISSNVTYEWSNVSGNAEFSGNNTATITITEINSDKAVLECKATLANYKDENGNPIVLTKTFTAIRRMEVATYWLECSTKSHAGEQQNSDIIITAMTKLGGSEAEVDEKAVLKCHWEDNNTELNTTGSHTFKIKNIVDINDSENDIINIKNKNLIIEAYHNDVKYDTETIWYTPINTPVLTLTNENDSLNYDSYGINKIDSKSVSSTAELTLNNAEVENVTYTWTLNDCSNTNNTPTAATNWDSTVEGKSLDIYYIEESTNIATATCNATYKDNLGRNKTLSKTFTITKNKPGRSLYNIDINNDFVTVPADENSNISSSVNLINVSKHELSCYYGDSPLTITEYVAEDTALTDDDNFRIKYTANSVTVIDTYKPEFAISELAGTVGNIIYELYRGNTKVAVSKFEISKLVAGAAATSYWIDYTSAVHKGQNQLDPITATAWTKYGTNNSTQNDDLYIRYSWKTGVDTDGKPVYGTPIVSNQGKVTVSTFQNTDLKFETSYEEDFSIIEDSEIITYSPLNTPILDLSNDSATLVYKPTDEKFDSDSVVSKATVYLDGQVITEGVTYEWTYTENEKTKVTGNDTDTLTVSEIGNKTVEFNCKAIIVNTKLFKDPIEINKVFTVSKQIQGESSISYWLTFDSAVHLGSNQKENITVTAMQKIGTAGTDDIDESAYLWWWNPSNMTANKWEKALATTIDNGSFYHKLIFTVDDFENKIKDNHLRILATHDSSFEPDENTTATHEKVYEFETITYSPLNTPVLDLDNDSATILYSADGTELLGEPVSSEATLYLNGDELPDVTYDWTFTNCEGTTSIDGKTATVSKISIAEKTKDISPNATCKAKITSGQFASKEYTKVFSVFKTLKGDNAISYSIVLDNKVIIKDPNTGNFSPEIIIGTLYIHNGNSVQPLGGGKIKYNFDGDNFEDGEYYKVQVSAIDLGNTSNAGTFSITLPDHIEDQVEILFLNPDNSSTVVDREVIKVISNGLDGQDGEDGKDGTDGKDGISVKSQTTYYALIHPSFTANTIAKPESADELQVKATDGTALEIGAQTLADWFTIPPAHTPITLETNWKYWTTIKTEFSSGNPTFSTPIINEEVSGAYKLAQGKTTNYYSVEDPANDPNNIIKKGDCWFKTVTNSDADYNNETGGVQGKLYQWNGTAWEDIGGELVTNKLTANYINALDITAKRIEILDDNKTLFKADGIGGNGTVEIAGFEVTSNSIASGDKIDKNLEDGASQSGVYIGTDGISIGSGFKVTAGGSASFSDGIKNDLRGFSIVASVARPNFAEAAWTTYGTIGHEELWTDTSNIRNGCRVGDIFTIVGTATDTKNAHVLYYKSTTDSGELKGICLSHSIAERGAPGADSTVAGPTGRSVVSTTKYYKLTSSTPAAPTTKNPTDWFTSPPAFTTGNNYYESVRTVYNTSIDGKDFSWSTPVKNSMLTVDFINSLGITAEKIEVKNGNTLVFSADSTENKIDLGGFTVDGNRLYYLNNNKGVGIAPIDSSSCWAFWAGEQNGNGADVSYGDNAPFRVGHSGNLYARSAFIGDGIIGGENGICLVSYDQLDNTKIGNEETKTWRITAGKNFGVDKSGNLHASSANITGKITANYLNIEGATVRGKISASNIEVKGLSADGITVKQKLDTDTAETGNTGPTVFEANATDGKVKIGGFTVTEDTLSAITAYEPTNGLPYFYKVDLSTNKIDLSTYLGTESNSYETGLISISPQAIIFGTDEEPAFKVDSTGNMTAKSGEIGGFKLEENLLYQTETNATEDDGYMGIGLSSSPNKGSLAIWAGNQTGEGTTEMPYGHDAPFRVGHNGDLYAASGQFKNIFLDNKIQLLGNGAWDSYSDTTSPSNTTYEYHNVDLIIDSFDKTIAWQTLDIIDIDLTNEEMEQLIETPPKITTRLSSYNIKTPKLNTNIIGTENETNVLLLTNLDSTKNYFKVKITLTNTSESNSTVNIQLLDINNNLTTAFDNYDCTASVIVEYHKEKKVKYSSSLGTNKITDGKASFKKDFDWDSWWQVAITFPNYVIVQLKLKQNLQEEYKFYTFCAGGSKWLSGNASVHSETLTEDINGNKIYYSSTNKSLAVLPAYISSSISPEQGIDLGSDEIRFRNIYTKNIYTSSTINSSDLNLKNTIQNINTEAKYDTLFNNLNPVSFKFNDGTSNRIHLGLIAQELKQSILDAGFTTQDIAAYCEWEAEDSEATCGIRYTELIPLNIDQIQKLKKRVSEQENNIKSLEERIKALENK